MLRLIALYRKPPDPRAFDDHYFNVHVPLIKQLPGLKKPEFARITGAPIGDPRYYLLTELYFESQQDLETAMASAEGRTSAKDLMSFAAGLVDLFFAEVETWTPTTLIGR